MNAREFKSGIKLTNTNNFAPISEYNGGDKFKFVPNKSKLMSNIQTFAAVRIYNEQEVEDCTLDSKFTVGALSSDVYKNENQEYVLGRADSGMAFISFTPTVGV